MVKNEFEKNVLGELKFIDMVTKLPWNKLGNKWAKRNTDDINKIIIHQSLSDGKIESINAYSISKQNHIAPGKGCPHIPYHIAIDKKGKIILCNNFDNYLWHTKGQNRIGLSVCVLGNFIGTGWNKGHDPSKKQIESLEELIKQLLKGLKLGNNSLYGHYHFGKPACPGKTISALIESIRNDKKIDDHNKLDTVKEIQQALIDLGLPLDKFGADGIMGTETKEAINRFQIMYKIPITGIADERTRDKMINVLSARGK
jgi:N-acetyl-anhydromuramyl-L-alanine amidase AmpD